MLPGAPLASLIRSRYCEAAIRWIGPTSATTVPPADDPPAGPSVKSHSVPADSAASPQGPAAACACASVGKRSIRQNSSPAGRSATRFSASGLMTSRCCPSVADGRSHAPAPNMAIAAIRTRFINLRLPFRATAGYHPDGRESRLLRARPALVARAPPVVEDRRNRNDLLEAGATEPRAPVLELGHAERDTSLYWAVSDAGHADLLTPRRGAAGGRTGGRRPVNVVIFDVALTAYILAAVAAIAALASRRDALGSAALLLTQAGWVCHTAAVILRGVELRRLPFTTLPEMVSLVIWAAILLDFWVERRRRIRPLAAFVLPVVLALGLGLPSGLRSIVFEGPAPSGWVMVHVALILVGLAALVLN